MRIDAVVINASPLITLFRSGQADLLPRLFTHIVVPEAVWQEVVLDEWEEWADRAARELSKQSWPVRAEVTSSPRVAAWELGAGETAVLSHALANPPLRAMIRHGRPPLCQDAEYSHAGHRRTAGACQTARFIAFSG